MKQVSYVQSKLCYLLRYPPEVQRRYQRLFRHVGHWLLTEANRQEREIETVIEDVCRSGCGSGRVSPLIYHGDTKRFYIRFMDEIHELLEELEEASGVPLPIQSHRATTYAWFGFEAMVYRIQALLAE